MLTYFHKRRNAKKQQIAREIIRTHRARATHEMACKETLLAETNCKSVEQVLSECDRCEALVEAGDLFTINVLVQKFAM